MPKQQTLIFDGVKAVPPWDFENDKGWVTISGDDKLNGIDLFIARVPWLYRGMKDRANCVSSMPWFVVKGETDYDSFGEYENKLGWLPNPRRLFSQLEQSLIATGRAYVFLETNNGGYIKGAKYCNPYTVKEVYADDGSIKGYKRRIGSRDVEFPIENFVAIYASDYLTETGPGKLSDAGAALMAAGVMFNAEGFIQQFFRRGAIKATVLTTEGTSQPEAERLQHWWDDVVSGVKNAWAAIVLRGKIAPVTIGEGLESLQNKDLTQEQRQEIATALGVPESRLWSAAANYATAQQDEVNYYNGTIIPDCDLITAAFAEQAFNKAHRLEGFRLEARYETLDAFQVDNKEQADAYSKYVSTGMKPSVAAQILGIELPAGMEYEDLDPEEEPKPEPAPVVVQMPPEPEDEEPEEVEATEQEMRSVLKAWRKKAELAFKKTGSAEVEFVTKIIPHEQQEAIRAALAAAKNQDDIRAAMDATEAPKVDYELKALADQLNQAWAALKAEPPTITIPPINYPPMTVNISMPNMEPQITVTPSTAEISVAPAVPQVLVSPTPIEVKVDAPVTVHPAPVTIHGPQVVKVNRDKNGDIQSMEAQG